MNVSIRILLVIVLSACASTIQSQSFYKYKNGKTVRILLGAGITSYSGELMDQYAFKLSNPNASAGVQLDLSNRIAIRGEVAWYRISGADNADPSAGGSVHRNLSFASNNLELSIAPVIYLLPEKDFSATTFPLNIYVTAGVGISYFNPKAEYQGKSYRLRPLKTEGVEYEQITLVLPAGFGIKYKLNNVFDLALEGNYHFTRTDYLDDVSTVYLAQSAFTDPVASVLADRRQELGFKPSPAGAPRGNPETNDGYLIVGMKVTYNLPSNDSDRVRRFR